MFVNYIRKFVELGHFDKRFVKSARKRGFAVTVKTIFWLQNVTQRWTQPGSGSFFPKSGNFLRFSNKGRGGLPSLFSPPTPQLTPLILRQQVWLNTHQYPWTCLNILKKAWINCSNYSKILNIHDYLTCSTGFWRCLVF